MRILIVSDGHLDHPLQIEEKVLRKGTKRKGQPHEKKIMTLCTPNIGNLLSVVDASDSPGLRIDRNAAYLFVSDICVRVVTVVASILVARYLGPEQYGVLAVAMAKLCQMSRPDTTLNFSEL